MQSAVDQIAEVRVEIPQRASQASKFLNRERKSLNKYRGGMPLGFFVSIGHWESGGKMDAGGDVSLGEVGIYQITESSAKKLAGNADLRRAAHGNIAIAGMEYNVEAAKAAIKYPVIQSGSWDQWLFARLVFAIGANGAQKVIEAANPMRPYHVYEDIVAYVLKHGAPAAGSQSSTKVAFRVLAVLVQKAIGDLIMPDEAPLPPSLPPAPPGIARWKVPKDVKLRPEALNIALATGYAVAGALLPGA